MCKYHKFLVLLSNSEAQVERCELCGHKEIYRKLEGTVDNKKYLKDHIRDTAQPFGSTAKIFEEIYGRAHRKKMVEEIVKVTEAKKKKPEEVWEELKKEERKLNRITI